MASLNSDVLERIGLYLNNDRGSIVSLLLVNKHWYRSLYHLPWVTVPVHRFSDEWLTELDELEDNGSVIVSNNNNNNNNNNNSPATANNSHTGVNNNNHHHANNTNTNRNNNRHNNVNTDQNQTQTSSLPTTWALNKRFITHLIWNRNKILERSKQLHSLTTYHHLMTSGTLAKVLKTLSSNLQYLTLNQTNLLTQDGFFALGNNEPRNEDKVVMEAIGGLKRLKSLEINRNLWSTRSFSSNGLLPTKLVLDFSKDWFLGVQDLRLKSAIVDVVLVPSHSTAAAVEVIEDTNFLDSIHHHQDLLLVPKQFLHLKTLQLLDMPVKAFETWIFEFLELVPNLESLELNAIPTFGSLLEPSTQATNGNQSLRKLLLGQWTLPKQLLHLSLTMDPENSPMAFMSHFRVVKTGGIITPKDQLLFHPDSEEAIMSILEPLKHLQSLELNKMACGGKLLDQLMDQCSDLRSLKIQEICFGNHLLRPSPVTSHQIQKVLTVWPRLQRLDLDSGIKQNGNRSEENRVGFRLNVVQNCWLEDIAKDGDLEGGVKSVYETNLTESAGRRTTTSSSSSSSSSSPSSSSSLASTTSPATPTTNAAKNDQESINRLVDQVVNSIMSRDLDNKDEKSFPVSTSSCTAVDVSECTALSTSPSSTMIATSSSCTLIPIITQPPPLLWECLDLQELRMSVTWHPKTATPIEPPVAPIVIPPSRSRSPRPSPPTSVSSSPLVHLSARELVRRPAPPPPVVRTYPTKSIAVVTNRQSFNQLRDAMQTKIAKSRQGTFTPTRSIYNAAQRVLYHQLGRLVGLQKLTLEVSRLSFSRGAGLFQLSTLKKLKELEIMNRAPMDVKKDDLLEILAEWPALELLRIGTGCQVLNVKVKEWINEFNLKEGRNVTVMINAVL